MASDILDRVGMVITDTGTGDVTTNVLISNRFFTPAEAGAINGRSYWWMLEQDNDVQIFEGIINLTTGKVARATTWHSKIGGVKGTANMNLAGNATLRSITPAEAFLGILRFDRVQALTAAEQLQGRQNLKIGKSDNRSGNLDAVVTPGAFDGVFTNSPDGTSNYFYGTNQVHSNDPGSPNAFLVQTVVGGLDGATDPRIYYRLSVSGAWTKWQELGVTPIIVPKTANYNINHLDAGRVISVSVAQGSTVTLGALAATTAGNGFAFMVENTGYGSLIFDPTGSETIDGRSTLNVYKGQPPFWIISDGTNWRTAGRASVWAIASATPAGVAAVDFTLPDGLVAMDLRIAAAYSSTANAVLLLRTSADGTNFDAGSTDYAAGLHAAASASSASYAGTAGSSASAIQLSSPLINAGSAFAASGDVNIKRHANTQFSCNGRISHFDNSIGVFSLVTSGGYRSATSVKAIRLLASAGNLTADSFILTGHSR